MAYTIVLLSVLAAGQAKAQKLSALFDKARCCLAEYRFLVVPTCILFAMYLFGCLSRKAYIQ